MGRWGDGEGTTNILRTTNFRNDGTLDFSNVVQRNIPQKKIDQKALKFGDTIIEKSGGSPTQPVGRVVFFNKKSTKAYLCNNFTSVIRPTEKIESKFLFWNLFNNHLGGKTLSYQNKTTGIINLQLERYIKEIQIPLPPITTQKYIAQILDKADALRKNDQQLLKYYDELAQSLFISLFGDPVKNEKGWDLENGRQVFNLIGGAAFKSTDYIEEGIPLIRIGTVNKGYFDESSIVFLSREKLINYSKYVVFPDALLMTLTGTVGKEDYGNTFTLRNDYEKYFLNQRVVKIKTPSHFNTIFIDYFFKQKSVKRILIGVSRGVRQANISNEDFYKLNVIAPPIALQDKFAQQIQNIEKQKEKVKAQMQASEETFQALLQQVFA